MKIHTDENNYFVQKVWRKGGMKCLLLAWRNLRTSSYHGIAKFLCTLNEKNKPDPQKKNQYQKKVEKIKIENCVTLFILNF